MKQFFGLVALGAVVIGFVMLHFAAMNGSDTYHDTYCWGRVMEPGC